MADRRLDRRIFGEIMFPLSARQFSSTFLDFCRNSRGYGDDVRTEDKDATKRLLSPASAATDNGATNKCTIPICHPLGNIMWDFVRQCTVVESQSRKQETDPLRACGWNSQREYDFINNNACQSDDDDDDDEDVGGGGGGGGVSDDDDDDDDDDDGDDDDDDDDDDSNRDSSGDNVDDDDDDIDISSDSSQNIFHCVIEQASLSEETKLSSDLLNEVENMTRVDNNFILDDGLCEVEKNIHSEELVSAYWPSGDNGTSSDFSNGKHLSGNSVRKNGKNSNESLLCDKTEMIEPLPLKKQGKYHGRTVSPSVTMNLKMEALNLVLNTETRLSRNVTNEDVDIYGKVAILYGSQETDSSHISVLESEVVGLYDYITGIVETLERHGCRHQDNHGGCKNTTTKDLLPSRVNTFVHLSAFLEQHHQIPQTSLTTTASTGPVAWLLTSPALGVTLDWQVEDHFHRLMQEWNFQEKEEDQRGRNTRFLSQWQSVLVVVDEYRQLEKDIPQIEVYKLCSSGIIKLVNFDLTE